MAQNTYAGDVDGAMTGNELVTYLNALEDSDASQHSGTTRPSYITAGMLWVKIDTDTNIMYYDGTTDHILFSIDISASSQPFLTCGAVKLATSAPTGYRGRMYFNSTSGLLYVYNGTAWVAVNTPLATFKLAVYTSAKTSSYPLVDDDGGKIVPIGATATGTITITVPSNTPVTIDNGWQVAIMNRSNAGTPPVINIARNGQNLNGAAADLTDILEPHKMAYISKVGDNDWEVIY